MSNFFTNVLQPSPLFADPSRCSLVSMLEPVTRAKVSDIIAAAQEQSISLMVYETYRSQARQEQLFTAGATQLRHVGVHHWGLACDIVRSINNEPVWKGDWVFLGDLARANGMIWGGDWGQPGAKHSFVDSVHVQRCRVADQNGLFANTWYPDDSYDPYSEGGGEA